MGTHMGNTHMCSQRAALYVRVEHVVCERVALKDRLQNEPLRTRRQVGDDRGSSMCQIEQHGVHRDSEAGRNC